MVVGTAEDTALFLRGAFELLRRHGRMSHYLERYDATPHESLGQDTPPPLERRLARPALGLGRGRAALALRRHRGAPRVQSNDHVIQFEGGLYEAPRGLARQKVCVYRRLLGGVDDVAPVHLSVLHDGRMQRLHPVDLVHNARTKRGRAAEPELEPVAPVKTAATVAFERDHAPLVGPDGGFTDKE